LPSVVIAGGNTQFNVTLCPDNGRFTVCALNPQHAVTSNQLGSTIFNPTTGIAEIPVIRIQGVTNNDVGISSSAYSVELKLVNDKLQLMGLTPIW
jgi:hypothetical protein